MHNMTRNNFINMDEKLILFAGKERPLQIVGINIDPFGTVDTVSICLEEFAYLT